MSRGVGYIAGVSLDELHTQWGALFDQGVDVILFDRTLSSQKRAAAGY